MGGRQGIVLLPGVASVMNEVRGPVPSTYYSPKPMHCARSRLDVICRNPAGRSAHLRPSLMRPPLCKLQAFLCQMFLLHLKMSRRANHSQIRTFSAPNFVVSSQKIVSNEPPSCHHKLIVLHSGIVFEDAPSGVRSGRAAGCITVALLTTHSLEQLKAAEPDFIIKDLSRSA